jgi:hypothetical protein
MHFHSGTSTGVGTSAGPGMTTKDPTQIGSATTLAVGEEAPTGRPEPAETHGTAATGSPKQRSFLEQQPTEVEMRQQRAP